MKNAHTTCSSRRTLTVSALSVLAITAGASAQSAPQFVGVTFLGGAGNQSGTGLAISNGALFVSGIADSTDHDGLVARFPLPLSATPTWSSLWPQIAGEDAFSGIAASSEGLYLAGYSYNRTIDIVGGKEVKGITVKYPLSGPPGGGFDGATWDRQTPGAPGAFAYGGSEFLNAVTTTVEAGQPVVYVTGFGQNGGANGGRCFVSKLDTAGTVLWTQTDAAEQVGNFFSSGRAITTSNGSIYIAGRIDDPGTFHPYIRKYGPAGNLLWSRRSASVVGQYNGISVVGGAIYAVGGAGNVGTAGPYDFLIEKWDDAGNLLWSRQIDRGGSDQLNSVTSLSGRLFAAGSTTAGTLGGSDAALVEFSLGSGALISTTLYGGGNDDAASGITSIGCDLYIVGESRSFAVGGNAVGQNDLVILQYNVAPPACRADFNGDGVVNSADFFDFIVAFFAGC